MGHTRPVMPFIASRKNSRSNRLWHHWLCHSPAPVFVLFLFLVCIQSLRYLLVLAQIGNLVSWPNHLMTYVNRLMDYRGRILYSAEWETAEAAVLFFFVLSSLLFWMQDNYVPWSGEQPFDIWAMNSHAFVFTPDLWQSVDLNLWALWCFL